MRVQSLVDEMDLLDLRVNLTVERDRVLFRLEVDGTVVAAVRGHVFQVNLDDAIASFYVLNYGWRLLEVRLSFLREVPNFIKLHAKVVRIDLRADHVVLVLNIVDFRDHLPVCDTCCLTAERFQVFVELHTDPVLFHRVAYDFDALFNLCVVLLDLEIQVWNLLSLLLVVF